jgi:hypothetical protein
MRARRTDIVNHRCRLFQNDSIGCLVSRGIFRFSSSEKPGHASFCQESGDTGANNNQGERDM